jgi:hypothetical protein
LNFFHILLKQEPASFVLVPNKRKFNARGLKNKTCLTRSFGKRFNPSVIQKTVAVKYDLLNAFINCPFPDELADDREAAANKLRLPSANMLTPRPDWVFGRDTAQRTLLVERVGMHYVQETDHRIVLARKSRHVL